jgi:hypothetical protein
MLSTITGEAHSRRQALASPDHNAKPGAAWLEAMPWAGKGLVLCTFHEMANSSIDTGSAFHEILYRHR